jgi:hypothetical protein
MAALTATDWVITPVSAPRNPNVDNGVRTVRMQMSLATVGTYPSGGIPIPTAASAWGMKRGFEYISIYDAAQNNVLIPKYSATGNVIRLYQQQGLSSGTVGNLIELATTATAGSATFGDMILYVEAKGY